ncbi:SDR family oxidoreductase [Actibacterium mucosum]|nr:SDR family NAD(P)-dependent oxidoreductase [Actibacterium mucosum]
MKIDLKGRTILLTGATRGIGRKMTDQLVARGAKVLAIARDDKALCALEACHPGRVFGLAADLGQPGMARAVANWTADQHPECSVLINNAAVMHQGMIRDLNEGQISDEVTINLTAAITLTRLMLPTLERHPTPAIVNVTSGLAIAPLGNAAVYCATKAGLRHFTKVLRHQKRRDPMLVSEAIMTLVDTSLSQGAPENKMPADKAAAAILSGLQRGKAEIWVGKTKLLRVIWRVSPAIADRIMLEEGDPSRRRVRKSALAIAA